MLTKNPKDFVFDRLIGMSVWYRGGGVIITHTSFQHVAISKSTPWCGSTITLCVSLIPRPSHVFQRFTRKTLKNMKRLGYETIVCIHYDLEHFVHGTQCMFSKLVQDESGTTALIQACERGHVETARVLLDHGANVDHQNNVSCRKWWF